MPVKLFCPPRVPVHQKVVVLIHHWPPVGAEAATLVRLYRADAVGQDAGFVGQGAAAWVAGALERLARLPEHAHVQRVRVVDRDVNREGQRAVVAPARKHAVHRKQELRRPPVGIAVVFGALAAVQHPARRVHHVQLRGAILDPRAVFRRQSWRQTAVQKVDVRGVKLALERLQPVALVDQLV